jgi:hypothetical protein
LQDGLVENEKMHRGASACSESILGVVEGVEEVEKLRDTRVDDSLVRFADAAEEGDASKV